jgi:hypothetical protein
MFRATERRPGRRRLWALALAAGVLVLARAAAVRANEITLFSCHDPAGNAVGHDGWGNVRSADADMIATDSCEAGGAGALNLELGANGAGYQNGAQTEWLFQAPAWASIASYTLDLGGSYADPSTGGGSGQAFVDASDESDPNYDYRNLGAGAQGAWVISRTPPTTVQALTLNASCDGQDGPCHANTRIASLSLTAAKIVLRDPTTPTVSALSGTVLPGVTVRGSGQAGFDASDTGPGIYSAWLTVDGLPQRPVLLDSNGGWCQNLGLTSDGTRSFAHADPCMASVSGSVALDTSALADGEHTIALSVDDASGNATSAFDGTFTTDNAPVSSAAPAITLNGPAGVGSALSASAGSWSAPAGAGAIAYGYQWQQCDTHGGECETIAGAQSSTYTTTSADAGHTVRVLVAAADNDGLATAASAPTAAIAATPAPGALVPAAIGIANGANASERVSLHLDEPGAITHNYGHSALTLTGELRAGAGPAISGASLDVLESSAGRTRVIGHAVSDTDGRFIARVAGGPSRSVLVGYRADTAQGNYSAIAAVKETVLAGVGLSIAPRRTSPTGAITLAGRVKGTLPRTGVIVELLVHYRGVWEPFRTPRTDAHGRFSVRYQFQGATGRFPFRAAVPGGQAGFPYGGGHSATVMIATG